MKLLSNIKCSYEDDIKRFDFDMEIEERVYNISWFYDSSLGAESIENHNGYIFPSDFYDRIERFLDFILDAFDETGIGKEDCQFCFEEEE